MENGKLRTSQLCPVEKIALRRSHFMSNLKSAYKLKLPRIRKTRYETWLAQIRIRSLIKKWSISKRYPKMCKF